MEITMYLTFVTSNNELVFLLAISYRRIASSPQATLPQVERNMSMIDKSDNTNTFLDKKSYLKSLWIPGWSHVNKYSVFPIPAVNDQTPRRYKQTWTWTGAPNK